MKDLYSISMFLFLIFLPFLATSAEKHKVHIVYLGGHSAQTTVQEIEERHHSYLLSVKQTEEDAKLSLLYSYKNINGFAAILTEGEASKLSEMEGEQDHSSLKSKYGGDVVVGLIDTGVWPESESFNDRGIGLIPKSWKGTCESGDAFNSSHCNNKIIGARYYIRGYEAEHGRLKTNQTEDYRSPRDKYRHGTHTSSTATGRAVPNVSALGGYAQGTATDGAPLARLAMYKVCWPEGCYDTDVLAAIEGAIDDGVNVLSISMGPDEQVPYDEDVLSIGTLHALQKNIIVAVSAGNEGPTPASTTNVYPWAITVGANSVDRVFSSSIVLENGTIIAGESISPYKLEKKLYPLAYAEQVANTNVSRNLYGQCLPGSLSPTEAKGKIILCFRGINGARVGAGLEVKRAGGVGLVLGNNEYGGNDNTVDVHLLPAILLNYTNSLKLLEYINHAKSPNAYLVGAKTVLNAKPAPFMATFSSRGPNTLSPDILKPDITAPGINILAAYSEGTSPTRLAGDNRVVKYNIMSGTSMSCPHVAGALALLKGVHPNWSSLP